MKYVLEFKETGSEPLVFEGSALWDVCGKIVKHFKGCDEWLPALFDLLTEITKAFIAVPESEPLEVSGFREVEHHRFAIILRNEPKGVELLTKQKRDASEMQLSQ